MSDGLGGTESTGDSLLRRAREELQGEWVGLQVVGRGHSPDEERRVEALSQAVQLIDQALSVLSSGELTRPGQ